MQKVKFVKDLGYMYDLFFLFVLHFNKDLCLTQFINYNKASEDTKFFNGLLEDFEPISDELFPFFYMKNDSKCFMTEYYHETYNSNFTTSYNLNTVGTALTDYNQVKENLIQYYFHDIIEKEPLECIQSFQSICKMIKDSKYIDKVKSSLYSFFLEPLPVLQQLLYELMSIDLKLSHYYSMNFEKITDIQNGMDVDDLSERLKQCKSYEINIDNFNELYISICLLSKNCIKAIFSDKKAILLLGSDYDSCLFYLLNRRCTPDIPSIGNALAEINRAEILELLYNKNEATVKNIEQEIKLTGTNAYYHLNLMIKAGMINTRNQGKTIFYSINKQCFIDICEMLSKYGK